jgi:hypothetical protein
MKFLSVKNLKRYQHYKDRRPPWIKLHAEVLDDYAFTCLQDASKAHLMLLWVLASRMDNRIPYDLQWITQKLGATSPVDMEELILHGFIEVSQDDSTLLAPRKRSAMPETETETETEKRKNSSRKAATGSGTDGPTFNLAPYLDAHTERFPGSSPNGGRFARSFKLLERKHGPTETLRRWRNCLAAKGTFATPEELASHWSEYDTATAGKPAPRLTDSDRQIIEMLPDSMSYEEKVKLALATGR